MAIQKSEGILLKKRDFRETSIVVTLYTKDFGKIKGILKGVKQDPTKFGTFPNLFSHVHAVFYEKATAAFYLVSQFDLLNSYLRIRKNLDRCACANYIIELLDLICPPYEPNKNAFNLGRLALESLDAADSLPASEIQKVTNLFEIKLLNLAGFKPRLDGCVACDREIVNRGFFSLNSAGVLCEKCRVRDKTARALSAGTTASIRYIENSDWGVLKNLKLAAQVSRELDGILADFLTYNLESKIQSRQFLNKLSAAMPAAKL